MNSPRSWLRLKLLFGIFTAAIGCSDQLSSNKHQGSLPPYISLSDFAGINSARNTTRGIEVSWNRIKNNKNIIGYRVYRYNSVKSAPVLIATIEATELDPISYVDGTAISGSKYTYSVKTVDPTGDEDLNTVKKSAFAWSGLTSVTSTSTETITVSFDPIIQHLYLRVSIRRIETPNARPQFVRVLYPASPEMTSGNFTFSDYCETAKLPCNKIALKPGAKYEISAEIFEDEGQWDVENYCNTLEFPDCNTNTYSVLTQSYGFDGVKGGLPGWKNITHLRAFGDSPNTVQVGSPGSAFVPNTIQVDLGFKAFDVPSGYTDYEYVVFRAGESSNMDLSILDPDKLDTITGKFVDRCPLLTDSDFLSRHTKPCIVNSCAHLSAFSSNSGQTIPVIYCHDSHVWKASFTQDLPRYRYTMAIRHKDSLGVKPYNESFSADKSKLFTVLVPVPPKDMVLVNREAVNYEMCQVQLKRSPDPLNHNRCTNRVTGSQPFNSGPDKPPLNLEFGYYDFGYNLFVDRYPLACKTDPNNSPPSVDKEAKWVVTSNVPNCRVYVDANPNADKWTPLNALISDPAYAAIDPALYYRAALTIDPGENQLHQISSDRWSHDAAQAACSSFNDKTYGNKRIPRMREYRSFAAPPISVQVETFLIKDKFLEDTDYADAKCMKAGADLKIGNADDAMCMSRYGIANIIDKPVFNPYQSITPPVPSSWYPVSDMFLKNGSSFIGMVSAIDSGNTSLSYDFGGSNQTGYSIIPEMVYHKIDPSKLFNYPLGILMLELNSSYKSAYLGPPTKVDNFNQPLSVDTTNTLLGYFPAQSSPLQINLSVSARWSTNFSQPTLTATGAIAMGRVRCVLPAD